MKEKNDFMMIMIVALVAIVGIIIMASSGNNSGNYDDSAGQAAKSAASKVSPAKGYCVDSDGGIDYYVRGTVGYSDGRRETSYTDYCRNYNSSTLVEYYCKRNRPASLDYTCPQGCSSGACINQTAICGNGIIEPGEQCDDGNNNNGDMCSNQCRLTYCGDAIIQAPNGYGMMEQCDDGNINNNDTCTNNCTINAVCTDSDGGLNYYVKGTVSWNNGTFYQNSTDYCGSSINLIEYYCNGNYPNIQQYSCSDGCSNGACVNGTNQTVTKPDLFAEDILFINPYGNITLNNTITAGTPFFIVPRVKNMGDASVNLNSFHNRITIGYVNATISNYVRCTSYSYMLMPGASFNCQSDNMIHNLTPFTYPVSIGVDHYNNVSEWNENNNLRTEVIYIVNGSSAK